MQVGLLNILTLIFITLKLTGNIAWPWLVVLSPTILGVVLFIIYIIIAVWVNS